MTKPYDGKFYKTLKKKILKLQKKNSALFEKYKKSKNIKKFLER